MITSYTIKDQFDSEFEVMLNRRDEKVMDKVKTSIVYNLLDRYGLKMELPYRIVSRKDGRVCQKGPQFDLRYQVLAREQKYDKNR
jgi:hypothetical protein